MEKLKDLHANIKKGESSGSLPKGFVSDDYKAFETNIRDKGVDTFYDTLQKYGNENNIDFGLGEKDLFVDTYKPDSYLKDFGENLLAGANRSVGSVNKGLGMFLDPVLNLPILGVNAIAGEEVVKPNVLSRLGDKAYEDQAYWSEQGKRYVNEDGSDADVLSLIEQGRYGDAIGEGALKAVQSAPDIGLAMVSGGASNFVGGVSKVGQIIPSITSAATKTGLAGRLGSAIGDAVTDPRDLVIFNSVYQSKLHELENDPNSSHMSDVQKHLNAISSGLMETAMEKIGTFGILDRAKDILGKHGKDVAKDFLMDSWKKTAGKTVYDVAKGLGKNVGSEAIEEGGVAFAEPIIDVLTNRRDISDIELKKEARNILTGSLYGAMGGPMFGAAGAYGTVRNNINAYNHHKEFEKAYVDNNKDLIHKDGSVKVGKYKDEEGEVYVVGDSGDALVIMRNWNKEVVPSADVEVFSSVPVNDMAEDAYVSGRDVARSNYETGKQQVANPTQQPIEFKILSRILTEEGKLPVIIKGEQYYIPQEEAVKLEQQYKEQTNVINNQDNGLQTTEVQETPIPGNTIHNEESIQSAENATGVEAGVQPEQVATYPLDKDGDVDYDNIQDVEMFAQALKDDFGDESLDAINDEIAVKEKEIEKLSKTPNLKNRKQRKVLSNRVDFFKGVRESISPTPQQESVTVEETQPQSPEEVYNQVLNSEDIELIASTYDIEKSNTGDMYQAWEKELLGTRVDRKQLIDMVGDAHMSDAIKRNWVRSSKNIDTRKIDELAQELSSAHGLDITPQMVVDFIVDNPSNYARKTSPESIELSRRFSEIASKNAKKKIGGPESMTGKLYLDAVKAKRQLEESEVREAQDVDDNTANQVDFINYEVEDNIPTLDEIESYEQDDAISIDDYNEVMTALSEVRNERLENERQRETRENQSEDSSESRRIRELYSTNEIQERSASVVETDQQDGELHGRGVIGDAERVRRAESEVNTSPSKGQKEAGNYKKGHVKIHGLDITIEQPKGSIRSGVDENGKEWSVTMNNTYGYIRGTVGKDGDHIDVFLGDNPESSKVFVVDQVGKDKSFDEHKVMLGFDSIEDAEANYLANYEEGWQGLGNITEASVDDFKKWVKSSKRKQKAFTDYSSVRFRSKDNLTKEEQSIKDKAIEDGSFMKAPNGKDSKLTEKQWLQVRTKAFKEWFGDWELGLKSVNVVRSENRNFKNFAEAKKWAKENIVKTYNNEETGGKGDIVIGKTAIDKFFSSSATGKSDNTDVHTDVVSILPDIIRESIVGEVHSDYIKVDGVRRSENGISPGIKIHRLYGAVEIKGKFYRVKTTVKYYDDTSELAKPHSYEVIKIELLDESNSSELEQDSKTVSPIQATNLLKGVEKSYEKGKKLLDASKVVDENGEPLVVYHGSRARFNHFDTGLQKKGWIGKGFYFATSIELAKDYGRVKEVFLNIKKLYKIIGDEPSSVYYEVMKVFNSTIEETTSNLAQIFENNGYDGAYFNHWEVGGMYNAFSPEQIKSATDNTGGFSKDSDDIRFREKDAQESAEDFTARIENVVMEASKMLGSPVKTVQTRTELPVNIQKQMNNGVRYPGMHDPNTGEVFIVLDEIIDEADARDTVLHEVLGHKGLRVLKGEGFDQFLDDVFKSMPKAKRDEYTKRFNGDKLLATEEYLAEFAEGYVDPSRWEKVKAIVKEFLRSIGFDAMMSDADLMYTLWRAKNRLRGGESVLDVAKYVVRDMDVRFRGKPTVGPFMGHKETRLERIARQRVDGHRDLKAQTKEIVARGGKVDGVFDPYNEISLSTAKSRFEIDEFRDTIWKDFMRDITNVVSKEIVLTSTNLFLTKDQMSGMSKADRIRFDCELYLQAKHATERNNTIGKRKVEEKVQGYIKKHADASKNEIEEYRAKQEKHVSFDLTYAEIEIKVNNDVAKYKESHPKATALDVEAYRKKRDSLYWFFAGMTKKEASIVAKEYESKLTTKEISELWGHVNKVTAFCLHKDYEGDIISKKTRDETLAMYQFYVPMRGYHETGQDGTDYSVNNDCSRGLGTFHKAEGRKSLADSPIEYMMIMAESSILRKNENAINLKLHRMAVENKHLSDLIGLKMVWFVKSEDADGKIIWNETDVVPTRQQLSSGEYKSRLSGIDERGKSKFDSERHYVKVVVGGTAQYVYFPGDRGLRIVAALQKKDESNEYRGRGLAVAKGITRWMSSNMTAKNPNFFIPNHVRDIEFASIALGIEGKDPKNFLSKGKFVHAGILDYFRGVDSEKSRAYKEFLSMGAATGYIEMTKPEDISKDLLKEIQRATGTRKLQGKVHDWAVNRLGIAAIEKSLDYMASASENSIRFATYLNAIDRGLSKTEAAYEAKEITTNFNRRGSKAGGFMSLFNFMNAGIQGVSRFLELMRKADSSGRVKLAGHVGKRVSLKFLRIAGSMMVTHLMFQAWSRSFGGEDENGVSNYENLSPYVRRTNFIFAIGENKFIKIPVSPGFRMFTGVSEVLGQMWQGTTDVKNPLGEILSIMFGELTPVDFGMTEMDHGLARVLPGMSFGIVKPLVEIGVNRNFMGMKIANTPMANEEYIPEFKQSSYNTPDVLVSISKWLNSAAGGSEYISASIQDDNGVLSGDNIEGFFDINPAYANHLIRSYLGGQYGFWADSFNSAIAVVSGKDVDSRNIPIVSRFYENTSKRSSTMRLYYDYLDEAKLYTYVKGAYRKERDYNHYINVMITNENRMLVFNGFHKQVMSVNEQMKGVSGVTYDILNDEKKRLMSIIVKLMLQTDGIDK